MNPRPFSIGKSVIFYCTVMLLFGCAVMHKDTDVPSLMGNEKVHVAKDIQNNGGVWPKSRWWEIYGDRQLNMLVDRSLSSSPVIAAAKEKVVAARIKIRAIDASTGLYVGFNAALNRQEVSHNGFLSPFAESSQLLGTSGPWYTEGIVGLGAEYSLDIWGKDRDMVAAAVGASHAAEAELEETRLLLSSEVTSVYFDMQTTMWSLDLLRQAWNVENEIMQYHKARVKRGLEPVQEEMSVNASLLDTEKSIEQAEARLKMLREVLRTLTASGADETLALQKIDMPDKSIALPDKLGYELLGRRPDLQMMHWYLQASMNSIEAAKAAFYPSFDIKAFFGFDALHISDVLKRSSQQMNLIPGVSLPVFDSGRLNANLDMVRSERNLLIAEYNQSILNAIGEAARAAVSMDSLSHQEETARRRLDAISNIYSSVQAQCAAGLADASGLYEAQLPVIGQKEVLLELNNRKIHAQIALISALGGGYRADNSAYNKQNR